MNKKMYGKFLLYLVVVVVVVVLAVSFNKEKKSSNDDVAMEKSSDVLNDTAMGDSLGQAGSFSGSFLDLLEKGKDYECTIDTSSIGSISSAMVYVSDKKIRADFKSSAPSFGEITASIIIKDGYVYTWNSMSKTGVKAVQNKNYDSAEAKMEDQEFDLEYSYNYDCVPSAIDQGLFELPEGFIFKEV